MASIVFRNSSRRLLRAYFSKLGWLANVIWRIAFFNQLQVYPSWLWRSDLFRASLSLDLRAGPIVLTIPAVEKKRYRVGQRWNAIVAPRVRLLFIFRKTHPVRT